MLSPDARTIIDRTYGGKVEVAAISHNKALAIGRLLHEGGYKHTYSYVFTMPRIHDREPTHLEKLHYGLQVNSILTSSHMESERGRSAQQDVEDNPDLVVGPFYQIDAEGQEFCPPGLAVWEPVPAQPEDVPQPD